MLKFPRKVAIAVGLIVLAAAGSVVWLLVTLGWFTPPPTKFGWPVAMTNAAGEGARGLADGGRDGPRLLRCRSQRQGSGFDWQLVTGNRLLRTDD